MKGGPCGGVNSAFYRRSKRFRLRTGRDTKQARFSRAREWRRLRTLIKATDHVAPYIQNSTLQHDRCYLDAVRVIRGWLRGDLMSLDRDTLRRLAQHDYPRNNGYRPPMKESGA